MMCKGMNARRVMSCVKVRLYKTCRARLKAQLIVDVQSTTRGYQCHSIRRPWCHLNVQKPGRLMMIRDTRMEVSIPKEYFEIRLNYYAELLGVASAPYN